jgi:hypothetical protein
MKKYLLAIAVIACTAGTIALAGVNTEVFAGGTGAYRQAWEANDEAPPFWKLCTITMDCLRA